MKEAILAAGLKVLVERGLEGWTVDAVARRARCAKGLVHYHFGTKARLRAEVSRRLAEERLERRAAALASPGASGLDRLWEVLVDEVESGVAPAWFAVMGTWPKRGGGGRGGGGGSRRRPDLDPDEVRLQELGRAAARALEVQAFEPAGTRALLAGLDGFQLQLLAGAAPELVRDAYHQLWLAMLSP